MGYMTAMSTLKERFGRPFQVVKSCIDRVTKGPRLTFQNRKGLLEFADLLNSTYHTLQDQELLVEANTQTTLRSIFDRLPGKSAKIANHAVYAVNASLENKGNKPIAPKKSFDAKARPLTTLSTQIVSKPKFEAKTTQKNFANAANGSCAHCKALHGVKDCPGFMAKDIEFRRKMEQKPVAKNLSSAVKADERSQSVHVGSLVPSKPRQMVLLKVIPVQIAADNGKSITTLGLLDSGASATLMTQRVADKLGIKGAPETISINTVLATGQDQEVAVCECMLKPVDLDLSTPVDKEAVSILIGEDVPRAHTILEGHYGTDHQVEPYAVRTPLAWCVAGPTHDGSGSTVDANLTISNRGLDQQIDESSIVTKGKSGGTLEVESSSATKGKSEKIEISQYNQKLILWQTERHEFVCEDIKMVSVEDHRALDLLDKGTKLVNGHYKIGLLWRNEPPALADNRVVAEKRLEGIKRRFQRDTAFAEKYCQAMDVYFDKGYARVMEAEEAGPKTWYLPHHGVVNINTPGKFKVPSDDCDALRFLWWRNGLNKPPVACQMTSHIFGAADSPSVCTYGMRRCADDHKAQFDPRVAEAIYRSFYVDDFLKSVAVASLAILLALQLIELLAKGGFKLTKFMSNSKEFLKALPGEVQASGFVDLSMESQNEERALGVGWNVGEDTLGLQVTGISKTGTKSNTRRECLAAVSSLYDPLGLVGLVTLVAKRILQMSCKLKLAWDDELPEDLLKAWEVLKLSLAGLTEIRVPRWYFTSESEGRYDSTTFRHFGDWLRHCILLEEGVRRWISGVRVCDGQDKNCPKSYVRSRERRFKTYVANRVGEIRDSSTPEQWHHVPEKKLNLADLASRGQSVKSFKKSEQWFRGPDFLWQAECCWPNAEVSALPEDDPEIKQEKLVGVIAVGDRPQVVNGRPLVDRLIHRYSSWNKLLRLVAILRKFVGYLKDKSKVRREITTEELKGAELAVIKYVQGSEYAEEIADLQRCGRVKNTSPFKKLRPVLIDGILRVGG
ncbi:uncharacterized protein LOC135490994 [Lineus longissimus]|uniref:uncharacterized protein LOC135490994 n=1 Tax=Lineus longissimus TaxID=88925 RepID=UPI00315D6E86